MKIAGFCVVNGNYEIQLRILLDSLFKNLKIKIDFFVYYNKINNKNINKCVEFRKIPELNINFKSCTEYDNIMDLILSKIKIFSDLSKEYDQVFNIDLDMLVLKNLDCVFEKYKEPYLYGCLEDTNYIRLYERRKKVLNFIGITEKQYINAGFMILNFPFEFDENEIKTFFKLCPYSNCPEQDFLNWKFKNKIKIMPNNVNWNRFLPFETSPYIVHYLGFPKPWHLKNKDNCEIFFKKYFNYMKKIGISNF